MAAAGASEDKSVPSPTVYPASSSHDAEAEADAAGSRSTPYLRQRRCALCCGGCCVVIGVIILVLALTVFKVKEPRLTVNNVWLTAISAGPGTGTIPAPGTGTIPAPVATNATLTADISIKNPNAAAFKFSQTETDVYYRGQTVSVVYAPAGRVGAHGSDRLNVTVDLLADRLARVMNGTGLVFGQEYDLDTYTEINGTVNVLGIIKKDVEIKLKCSVVVEVGGAAAALEYGVASTVQSKSVNCLADVTL
ncbi:unnamed protein product [Miscanthus lutarioriparius]|uniref:Late embryogenesis abundant protein LEA-2 subgroup domain-containing protein n=1 Tax=Miscanthus lutarioriparius TaxID=422564 RepID=A0A811RPB6_9POAL|nr:unnamed protein product [Miscanthus lutarioriparius]